MVLCAAGTLGIRSPLAVQPRGTDDARPNVVLIMSDDVGYGDIGSYGAPDIRTPHIDSLARAGVRLTDFYANAPQCSPTRAALITGRYQQRYAIDDALGAGASGPFGDQGLAVTGRSLPQLLKNNGYATALIGKWHLGYRQEFTPRAHGFEVFFGFKSGYIDYYTHVAGDGQPDLWENDARVQQDGYMTDLITSRSVRFIEQHASRPFFLDVAYSAGHWPYQVPGKPSKAIDNGRLVMPHEVHAATRADYVAMMERMDAGVGEILATLERTGVAQRTMVIFTNDNGGEWLSRNAPLFHRKWTLWEGGIRVPTLLRWPGRIPAGRVTGQVGITMDLTATILAATQTPVPPDARLEGVNLLPILEGRVPERERTLFWRSDVRGWQQHAVRSGDFKLLVELNNMMVFDVRRDVSEREDLTRTRQDVAQRLWPLLVKWEKDVDAEAKARARPFP
jgi:arylsulfatase A-like enzyme